MRAADGSVSGPAPALYCVGDTLIRDDDTRVRVDVIVDDAFGAMLHFDDGGCARWEHVYEHYRLVPHAGEQ